MTEARSDADVPSLLRMLMRDFKSSWRSLLLTDLVFKVLAYVVLTPLAGVLFHGLLAVGGTATLSDMDIVYFFLGPYGWFCMVVVGAMWLAIIALELASLSAIVHSRGQRQRLHSVAALHFALANALPILKVAARIVAITLAVIAPFLLVAATIFFTLLTKYDINYYLKEWPPVFQVSVAVGAVLIVALLALLLRLYSGWFFALPLVLYEKVQPRDALKLSAERSKGHRRSILCWIVNWFVATTLISIVLTAVVAFLGRLIVPEATASVQRLALTVGMVLTAWAVCGLATNLLSTTTLAVILFRLYRRFGSEHEKTQPSLALVDDVTSGTRLRITRTRLLIAGVLGVLIATATGVFALRGVYIEDNVQIMAHRGSSKAAPENTLASIRQAINDGADWVEVDVQETADGEVVVFHDSDFMKIAGKDLKIWNATMDDLREIDIGSHFSAEYHEERVPTLAQVLNECHGKIGVNIELKYYGHDVQLEQRVAEIVDQCDMHAQVKAMSLKVKGVKKMKAIRPDWQVGLLMSVATGKVKAIKADFLAVNATFAKQDLIRAAHRSGKKVYVWTVNDAPTMSTMIGRGVDGLLTDKPAVARVVLQQRAQMSVPERLLLEIAGILGVESRLGEP